MKKIGVVILNYKVADLTLRALKSVQKSSYKNIFVIVVDNGSCDHIEDKLKNEKNVCFIQTGTNLGYAGGNNQGIKKALEENCEYIFILNPDTVCEKSAIDQLVRGLDHYNAQIASPKIYFYKSKKIWFAGKIFDYANVLGSHRGVDEIDKGLYDQDEQMEDATGAAMMVSRSVFERVGLFDERFFLYYEESDFCMRARKAGYKIMYLPRAVVYHENAQSTGLGTSLQDYFISRNRLLFAAKYLSWRTRIALLREALRNRKNRARRLALFDFLTGNFGKGSFLKE